MTPSRLKSCAPPRGGKPAPSERLRAREWLANGTPRVVIDPDPANAHAIRSYEKAGFQRDRVVETPDGPALLMWRDA